LAGAGERVITSGAVEDDEISRGPGDEGQCAQVARRPVDDEGVEGGCIAGHAAYPAGADLIVSEHRGRRSAEELHELDAAQHGLPEIDGSSILQNQCVEPAAVGAAADGLGNAYGRRDLIAAVEDKAVGCGAAVELVDAEAAGQVIVAVESKEVIPAAQSEQRIWVAIAFDAIAVIIPGEDKISGTAIRQQREVLHVVGERKRR